MQINRGLCMDNNEIIKSKVYQGENEIQYKTKINEIAFKGFKEADYNLFFAIVSRVVDSIQKGENKEIEIDYATIKKLAGLKNKHISNKAFEDDYLDPMSDKLIKCYCSYEYDNIKHKFALFPTFDLDLDRARLKVEVNRHFYYLLSDFDIEKGGFTKLELERFVNIDSKYTKTLYRNLRQFKATGKYTIKADKFRELYDVPESYKQSDIMKRIINPAIEELSKEFKSLKCETTKKPKQGAPVDKYIFTFQAVPKKNQQTEGQSDMFQATEEMQKYKKQKEKSKNSFNNFQQNTYDFDKLERQLLDN